MLVYSQYLEYLDLKSDAAGVGMVGQVSRVLTSIRVDKLIDKRGLDEQSVDLINQPYLYINTVDRFIDL